MSSSRWQEHGHPQVVRYYHGEAPTSARTGGPVEVAERGSEEPGVHHPQIAKVRRRSLGWRLGSRASRGVTYRHLGIGVGLANCSRVGDS
jgi:hypothetical protein